MIWVAIWRYTIKSMYVLLYIRRRSSKTNNTEYIMHRKCVLLCCVIRKLLYKFFCNGIIVEWHAIQCSQLTLADSFSMLLTYVHVRYLLTNDCVIINKWPMKCIRGVQWIICRFSNFLNSDSGLCLNDLWTPMMMWWCS